MIKYNINIHAYLLLFLESGGDVAGEVVEVGSLVKNFRVGDKVIAKLTLKVLV